MDTSLIKTEDLQRVTADLVPIQEQVKTLVIKTASDLQIGANLRKGLKTWEKSVNNFFDSFIDPINDSLKALRAKRNEVLAYSSSLVARLDEKVNVYNAEEDRKIALAKAKAEDELRKAREEQQRKVDELNAKELKARQEADERAKKLEEQGKTAQAEAVRQAGLKKAEVFQEKAVELLTTPIETKTIIPEKTKVIGMHFRTNYSVEITNKDLIPDEYWIPDITLLDRLAREQKEQFSVPGVKLVIEKTPVNAERGQGW
jgi:hypothetical protein